MKTFIRLNSFCQLLLCVNVTLCLCLFTACVEEQLESSSNMSEHTLCLSIGEANAVKIKKTGSYEIPENEAVEMMRQMYRDEIGTKSGNDFVIKSCKKVSFPVAASTMRKQSDEGAETGYYVIEFAADGKNGYSLVSADRRIEDVFAYTNQGTLNDTITNLGLKMFCRALPYYIQEQVKDFNVDSLYNAAMGRAMITRSGWIDDGSIHYRYMPYGFIPDPDYEYMGEEVLYEEGTQYGTFLTTQWGQSYPYNDKLPYISGTYQKAYAGCTLIAMIQIMAYHKKPYQNVTTADWTRFAQSSQCYEVKLQDCIRTIFDALPKDVDSEGTGISQRNAAYFLQDNGYKVSYKENYSSDDMSLPCMVSGYNSENEGHTWVVDAKRQGQTVTYDKYEKDDGYDIWRIYVEKHAESNPLYVHCNWGWYGSSDGWFQSGVFYYYNQFDYRQNLEMTNIQPN